MSEFINKKLPYIFIFIGLVYSIINSIVHTNKYDKFYFVNSEGEEIHQIIKGDIKHYWDQASLFQEDIKEGKSFLISGGELERNYLYPKFISIYYLTINKNIKNQNGKFEINNYKFGIPIIQSIIFYFVLIFFYKKLSKIYTGNALSFIVFFLALEPSMNQFHSSYWTESLYLSMLLLLFSFLLDLPKKSYSYLFLGIFIAIIYMQRSAGLFLFLPVIIYLIINLKYQAIKPSVLVLLGYSLVILFIGFQNHKRSGVFYITTMTHLKAPWHELAHKLNSNKLNTSEKKALKKKYDDMDKWINDNEINRNIVADERKLHHYKKKYFLESLKNNYFYFLKYHAYKSMQTLIMPLNDLKRHYNRDFNYKEIWQIPGWNNKYKFQIPYSLLIYAVSLIGLIQMILNRKKNERNLIILIFLFCIYHIGLLGWVGSNRYGVPIQIFYSIFFGIGAELIYKKFKTLLN